MAGSFNSIPLGRFTQKKKKKKKKKKERSDDRKNVTEVNRNHTLNFFFPASLE